MHFLRCYINVNLMFLSRQQTWNGLKNAVVIHIIIPHCSHFIISKYLVQCSGALIKEWKRRYKISINIASFNYDPMFDKLFIQQIKTYPKYVLVSL